MTIVGTGASGHLGRLVAGAAVSTFEGHDLKVHDITGSGLPGSHA